MLVVKLFYHFILFFVLVIVLCSSGLQMAKKGLFTCACLTIGNSPFKIARIRIRTNISTSVCLFGLFLDCLPICPEHGSDPCYMMLPL